MLSTEPRYVRDFKDHEVNAIHRFFRSIRVSVSRTAIRSAIYLGRTRENRRVGEVFSDEPCVYLVFPHMKDKCDIYVERLLKLVLIPAFEEALQMYDLPQVPGGVERAAPPIFRTKKDQIRGIMCHHEVRAYLGEDWATIETAPWHESTTASRQQIHLLAWENMQKTIHGSSNSQITIFKDMQLLFLVPQVGHSVVTDFNGPSSGGDIAWTLREALSLYDQDLDPEHLEEDKVMYAGEFDLGKYRDQPMTTSGSQVFSIGDFFRK